MDIEMDALHCNQTRDLVSCNTYSMYYLIKFYGFVCGLCELGVQLIE